MPSYSVSLNAVVSPTGGSVARLDAVCAAGPTSNYVVVATTANLAVAGGRFRGVALEAASGNQAIQIVDFGTIDLLTTVLTGTGEYVSVNATGQLVRTTSITTATVGTLENGTIHVNVALGLGVAATGNATAIQGVAVAAMSAIGDKYVYNGTSIYARRDRPDVRDWFQSAGGADNLSTDCSAAFAAAITALGSQKKLYVATPTTGILIREPIVIGGGIQGFTLVGDCGGIPNQAITVPSIFTEITVPSGTTGDITDYANGGSGWYTQTFDIKAGSGVLAADESKWLNATLVRWNAANNLHNGLFRIVKVPSDNIVRVVALAAAADTIGTALAGTDTNDGALHWRIYRAAIQVRNRSSGVDGIHLQPKVGTELGIGFELGHELNQASTPLRQFIRNSGCIAQNSNTSRIMFGAALYLPTCITSLGVNGRGDYCAVDPGQGESWSIERFAVSYANVSVGIWSYGAQAKTGVLRDVEVNSDGGIIHYANVSASTIDDVHGSAGDVMVQYAGAGSAVRTITNLYAEEACVLIREDVLNAPFPTNILGAKLNSSAEHPSGALMELRGHGPYNIIGGGAVVNGLASGNAAASIQVTCGNTLTRGITNLNIQGFDFSYVPTATSSRGRVTSTVYGPHVFSSGDDLTIQFNATGITRTFNITTTNLTRALAGLQHSTPDLNRVTMYQLGRLFDGGLRFASSSYDVGAIVRPNTYNGRSYVCTTAGTTSATASATATSGWSTTPGVTIADGTVTWTVIEGHRAWGTADGKFVYIMTNTDGNPGRVKVIGGAMNAKLGFSLVEQAGIIPTQICTDSLGYVLPTYASYGQCNVRLRMESCAGHITGGTSTLIPDIDKTYTQNASIGLRRVEGIAGLSGYDAVGSLGAVQIQNFNGSTDIADAATTATVAFVRAEPDAAYRVSSLAMTTKTGAPAAASYRAHVANKTVNGFDVVLEGAPGVGTAVTAEWMITR